MPRSFEEYGASAEVGRRADGTPYVERRRKKDWVVRVIPIFSVVGWILSITTLMLLEKALPESESFFTRVLHTPIKSAYNTALLRTSLISLTVVFLVCLTGFLFNALRHKRKSDRFSKSLMILGILSALGIGFFLWRYSAFLF